MRSAHLTGFAVSFQQTARAFQAIFFRKKTVIPQLSVKRTHIFMELIRYIHLIPIKGEYCLKPWKKLDTYPGPVIL
jgi:hypothetical protein